MYLQSSFAAAEHIFDVLDTVPTVQNTEYAKKVDKIKGNWNLRMFGLPMK